MELTAELTDEGVGPARRLEVKTESRSGRATVRFFLSRNEYGTGRRHPGSWALVACRLTEPRRRRGDPAWLVLGGRARALSAEDRNGRWTEGLVSLPLAALGADLPPPV